VLGGRPPTADDVPQLAYTRQIVSESMRLYPPAWIIGRRAVTDYELAGTVITAGSIVLLCPAVTHHDARWFPDPDRFDPERWTPEAQASRPRFSYFPFGGGPRVCIGEQFAWMEAILVLATLGQRWRLHLAPDQRIAWQPIVTLRPRYGMRMIPERRS
jgi:cytochrome P450